LIPPSLPKGWVYKVEKVNAEVKDEVVDPSQYVTITHRKTLDSAVMTTRAEE
jgi:hypothetical protein